MHLQAINKDFLAFSLLPLYIYLKTLSKMMISLLKQKWMYHFILLLNFRKNSENEAENW